MPQWESIEQIADVELAKDTMREVFRKGCGLIDALVAELWTWNTLPDKFEISGPAWDEAEAEICTAALAGHWWKVVELGDQYVARIETFCNCWRELYARKKAKAS